MPESIENISQEYISSENTEKIPILEHISTDLHILATHITVRRIKSFIDSKYGKK